MGRVQAEKAGRAYVEAVKKYVPMPAHPQVSCRGGCKVSWATYATEEQAREVAEWAEKRAEQKAEQGYDFGYQCPGSITKTDKGFEVCLP